jgi:hypothetical protein
MIESVHGIGEPVLNNEQRVSKEPGKPTASKPEVVDDALGENSAISPDNNSIQKPPVNTPEDKNVDIKELLEQCHHNNAGISENDLAKSELLGKIKETMERINTSEVALLGVDKLFEDFETSTQFGLEDIGTVEKNVKEQNMDLEIGLFSLTRIMEQARKALRGQTDTGPDATKRFQELAQKNAAGDAAQANTTKETIGETTTQSLAADVTEYLAKLEEANSEEESGDAQQDNGILAKLEKHLAAMNKIREEEIAAERKKQKDEIFYPEDNIKKQDKDNISPFGFE